jgi:glucose-1-phosphate thymidylyltransferase
MYKAVIMARGLGTRMRPVDPNAPMTTEQAEIAASGVKGMIPVGRPFMDYILGALADAGCTDICLVTGPEHSSVRAYYDALETSRIRISHAIQPIPRGTADAVASAEAFVGSDPFLALNSDNFYPMEAFRSLMLLEGPGLVAFTLEGLEKAGIPPERIATFPLVEANGEGRLVRLTDIARGTSPAASMNCWRFSPRIFEACRAIAPSPRGEFELPDAVQYSIDLLGESYRVILSDAGVLDLSTRADVARVQEHLIGQTVSL